MVHGQHGPAPVGSCRQGRLTTHVLAWCRMLSRVQVEHSKEYVAYVYDGITILNSSVTDPEQPLFWGMVRGGFFFFCVC